MILTDIKYAKCPGHNRGDLKGYIENKTEPGGFLRAVLCNNLLEACIRADISSMNQLTALIKWLYQEAPGRCWGSKDRVAAWLK